MFDSLVWKPALSAPARAEAGRIAANIAKLPEPFQKR
jgi:hypothetical protein